MVFGWNWHNMLAIMQSIMIIVLILRGAHFLPAITYYAILSQDIQLPLEHTESNVTALLPLLEFYTSFPFY